MGLRPTRGYENRIRRPAQAEAHLASSSGNSICPRRPRAGGGPLVTPMDSRLRENDVHGAIFGEAAGEEETITYSGTIAFRTRACHK